MMGMMFASIVALASTTLGLMSDPMADLSFMAGSWQAARGTGVFDETWQAPKGGLMLGMSRTVRGEKATFEEHLRIDVHEGKVRMLILQKFGEKPITFFAEKLTAEEVLFKAIDDPNNATVSYRKVPTGLFAVVEGVRDGQPYRLEFDFKPTDPSRVTRP